MQLFFFRHAESANNHLYATSGSWVGRSEDPEITPRGHKQTALMAEFLQTSPWGLTHIYTSLMVRAVQTAAVAAQTLHLPLNGWTDLHENGGVYQYDLAYINLGLADRDIPKIGLQGKTRAQLHDLFPALIIPADVQATGWWNQPYEALSSRPMRANRVLTTLLANHGMTSDRVAVFSHAGFYNHFLRNLLSIPPTSPGWFHLNNCAVSCIDFGEGDPGDQDTPKGELRLVFLNRTDYLPEELLT